MTGIRRTSAFIVATAALVASSCVAEESAPGRVDIDLCDDSAGETCELAFGTIDVSVRAKRTIGMSNRSRSSASILLELFEGDPAFRVDNAGVIALDPGARAFVDASTRPLVAASISATLMVVSDFSDDAIADSLTPIRLTANGIDNGAPDIRLSTQRCDVGELVIGQTAMCEIVVQNQGNRDLVFDAIQFGPLVVPEASGPDCAPLARCPFVFSGRPPSAVAPGETAVLAVRFQPDVAGEYEGVLQLATNDPDEQRMSIELIGAARAP